MSLAKLHFIHKLQLTPRRILREQDEAPGGVVHTIVVGVGLGLVRP